jgi:catechol 2,3-dioxygenase-like lactoylglutathione lyase family enzyme
MEIRMSAKVDLKLEVIVVPVTDVDRSKRFYGELGWRLDADFSNGPDWRVVQMTPPGSPCSIHFGKGITTAVAGLVQEHVSRRIRYRGGAQRAREPCADVSDPFHFTSIGGTRVEGADPEGRSYGSFAAFSDPDGNTWLLQETGRGFPDGEPTPMCRR